MNDAKASVESPLWRRLWQYQKERFNFLQNGLLIAAFVFSAASYSRLSRGLQDFIPWGDFLAGLYVVFTAFLLLRIIDEHKDAENDREHRSYLPVPRGLVSLAELRVLGWILFISQWAVILIFQMSLWWLYAICLVYFWLMTMEFFVADWLRPRPIWYMVSHMFIVPLIDLYSSSLDWKLAEAGFHKSLPIFLAVSFFNGMVLEVGRKIRIPENEEPGIVSFSGTMGLKKSIGLWIVLLTITFGLALWALLSASLGTTSLVLLLLCYLAALIPAILFLNKARASLERYVENAAGLWTIMMYLILGGIPMLISSLGA